MKLRQKLAAVMAATMVVTAVPVVTMAETTNSISNMVQVVKDDTIGYTVEAPTETTTYSVYTVNNERTPKVHIQPKSNYNLGSTGQSFFVTIENGTLSDEALLALISGEELKVGKDGLITQSSKEEWNGKKPSEVIKTEKLTLTPEQQEESTRSAAYTIQISKVGSKQLRVDLTGSFTKEDIIEIPVLAKASSSEVAVVIDGNDSFVSSERKVISAGIETNKKITATAGDIAKLTVDGGVIGDIILEENVLDGFKNTDRTYEITLPSSSDLEFKLTNIELEGLRGFSGKTLTLEKGVDVQFGQYRGSNDLQKLIITIPAGTFEDETARGGIVLKGIQVVPQGRVAQTGDVHVTIKAEDVDSTTLKVAEINEHGIKLTVKEEVEVVAGKGEQTVEFTLEETVKDSMVAGRRVEFTLENGFIDVRHKNTDATGYKSAMDTFAALVAAEEIELPEEIKLEDIVAVEANEEGQITGFTVELNHIKTTEENELTFKMPVRTTLEATGEIKLNVEGRAFAEAVETTLATVKAPFEVTAEAVELKVGLNGQVGGKITITETDKAMLEKGFVRIAMPTNSGMQFAKNKDIKVEAKGLTVKDVTVNAGEIVFQVERTSTAAGSIEISNIEFNVDRTTPEGKFDVNVYGSALSTDEYIKSGMDKLVIEDFVVIGTTNTEDINSSNKKSIVSFTVNSSKYVVNGEEKEMDGTVYITDKGRTMAPVRYVSEAFGIKGDQILFNKGTITLIDGAKVIQLNNGSNIARVNGVDITMDEAVVIKDGRTYLPIGEIGRLLNVSVSWNNETKTATFETR